MRITSQTLHKIARETVNRRARADRDLLAVYLHGSLLGPDPVLGGTADIDLVFVHNVGEAPPREIERLTDEVHLDITHHLRRDYRRGRKLRLDPWLGPTIYGCKILYDPQHFLDFTQASVRGHFQRPDYVLGRAQELSAAARQIWMGFYQNSPLPTPAVVADYLRAVECAANAVATLNGPPLPERRLLLLFPDRSEALGHPGLYLGLLGLLGGNALDGQGMQRLLPDWEGAFQAVGALPDPPPQLHPHRREYYQRAFQALLAEQPLATLWPLLNTWTQAACHLQPDSELVAAWEQAFARLEITGENFERRVQALDVYLDTVEELLEVWARENGA